MVRELLLSDFYFLRKLYYISKTEYSEKLFLRIFGFVCLRYFTGFANDLKNLYVVAERRMFESMFKP